LAKPFIYNNFSVDLLDGPTPATDGVTIAPGAESLKTVFLPRHGILPNGAAAFLTRDFERILSGIPP
jgi:hypothetical protein